MDIIHARCAGLDVHKRTVVACVRLAEAGRAQHAVRTFATTAAGLLALQEWLVAAGCTHAVLESTGVYWKPVWHMLEDHLTLVLANATAVRNLPGRKSDVSDAQASSKETPCFLRLAAALRASHTKRTRFCSTIL